MGKTRIIAETGAGQHGVASATVAARLGLECVVYMGATDIERQKINVYRMKLLGATVVPVTSGSQTLKDALNEAMRDWVTNVRDTFYIIGTVAGPDPYPRMVRDFNAVVGREARAQMLAEYGRLPDAVTACVGGGSNAIGLFHAFLNDRRRAPRRRRGGGRGHRHRPSRRVAGRRPPGRAARQPHLRAVRRRWPDHRDAFGVGRPGLSRRRPRARVPQGQPAAPSTSASTDDEALAAFHQLARTEGILPALESSHAIAQAIKLARELPKDAIVLCNLSGRGDKDVHTIAAREGIDQFLPRMRDHGSI